VDSSKQLQTVPEREPLTEAEAQRIGVAASRLARLRHLHSEAERAIGAIVIGSGYTAKSVQLGSLDLQAALAFLMERDELFLASFNVQIERPE
jgi:hypothetical protein